MRNGVRVPSRTERIYETVGRLDSGKSKLKCVSANKDLVFGIN